MSKSTPTHFEDQLRAVLAVPSAREDFVAALGERLSRQASAARPLPRFGWKASPARVLSLGVLVVLLAALLIIGPQRVLAQVLDWLGYVPGVGFVDQEGGLRVLEAPVSQTREDITVTIVDGLIDAERTRLTFYFEGIRQELKPLSEDEPGCGDTPSLLLPNGKVYPILEGEGTGGPSWMREEFRYGPLPSDMNEIAVLVPCVPEVRPGAGPEDWVFTIRFIPAPDSFEVLPVLPLPVVTTSVEGAAQPHGMQLSVEELVELQDGYLFRGAFHWGNSAYENPEFWDLEFTLTDADGNKIPLEMSYAPAWPPQTFYTWTAQTQTKQLESPVTFTVEDVSVRVLAELGEENSFVLNIGENPQSGQVWPINKVLNLGGNLVTVKEVTFEVKMDGTYDLLASIQRDAEEITALNLSDQDNHSDMFVSSSGPGVDPDAGDLILGIGYDYLPVGLHHFWVDNYFLRLAGPWTATVDLSALTSSSPAPETAACLTQQGWEQLSHSLLASLPPEAGGRVLAQDFSVGGMLPTLRLSGLDGSQPQTIDIGSWASLSPDGRFVAYAHDGLRITDLVSGQTLVLIAEDSSYAIAWSPDGSRLAFIRGGEGLYLINADGSDLHPSLGASPDMIGVAGWLPDGNHVVVATRSPEGTQVQTVNIETGAIENDLVIQNLKGGFARLSPDGTRIAFSEATFGGTNYSVHVANLDGSEKRLIAESGSDLTFAAGAWSADDQWLILNVSRTTGPSYGELPVLLNVANCQAVLLPDLTGEIVDWAP